jgi:hypothetical protein
MTDWFLRLIGISDEFVRHRGEATLVLQHPYVFWVGLVLLVPVAYFIYTRQRRNLYSAPPAVKIALTVTRVLVLLLLIVVLAGPFLHLHFDTEKKPIVAVLFDHSQSMTLSAGPFESEEEVRRVAEATGYQVVNGQVSPETRKALNQISRAKLAQSAAQNGARNMLQNLAQKFEVQYYSFAKDVQPIGVNPADLKIPDPPGPRETWGNGTEIGDAILEVLNKAGDRQVSGVILFSDGQTTGGKSPAEAAQQAQINRTPILAVQTGVQRRLKDVAVVDVFTSNLVSVGDTVRVAVTIESQGFDKRPVKVQLKEGDKLLDARDLILNSREQQQLELTFKADQPGPRYLTVHVPPQAEELKELHGNNTEAAFVRVSDEKLRVLYLEGMPRWDYRFLKNAMRRDHGLGGLTAKEPDIILESELRRLSDVGKAKAFPRSAKDLGEYHTIILGDVSPAVLTPDLIKAIDEVVRERGVGLIVEAGPNFMPHAYGKELLDLLPVKIRSRVAGIEAPGGRPFKLQLAPEGTVHEAMRFYDDVGRNQNAWSHLPAYYWCVAADRASPAASVLAWNPAVQNEYGKLPLIAAHYAGKGRVMLVGTDSTWMWRQNVGDRFFYKFWGQGLRYVARRDQAGLKKSWIEVNPYRIQPGEQAQVELMAYAPDGSPRTEPALAVQFSGGNQAERVELSADPGTKGRYLGKVSPKAPGDYKVVYNPGVSGYEPVEAKLRAQNAAEELRHPNVNRAALEMLAGTSKGMLLEPYELDKVPDFLQGESKTMSLDREATLWDNWLMLALLIGIYSIDVGLRRLIGLS